MFLDEKVCKHGIIRDIKESGTSFLVYKHKHMLKNGVPPWCPGKDFYGFNNLMKFQTLTLFSSWYYRLSYTVSVPSKYSGMNTETINVDS